MRQRLARLLQETEEQEQLGRVQDEMTARLARLQIERQAKLMEVERARKLRQAEDDAMKALEAAESSARVLRKQELVASAEAAGLFAEKGTRTQGAR